MPRPASRRAVLAPEVVQTSAMDCGPAALKALLEGFGVRVSYGRLREACQIDLDGTSIDTMEEVAVRLGLDAEQVMVPVDHLLLPEARCLPAIVVVRNPNGMTHFVVAWRRFGPLLQVMDPATGRRWMNARQFLDEVYVHRMPVPAAAWREWAESDEFLRPLKARLGELGAPPAEADRLAAEALADSGWRSLAALDAAARMVRSIVGSGGLRKGAEATGLLRPLLARCAAALDPTEVVPDAWWSVRPRETGGPPGPDADEQVLLRGAVLVRARERRLAGAAAPAELSPELAAAIAEPPARPGRELLRLLASGGALAPAALAVSLLAAGLGVVLEALFFRSFFDLGHPLQTIPQRAGALGMLFAVIALFLLLDLPITQGALGLGRHLETRLRIAFLRKIPLLGDRYFQSRLTSDMADRGHSVHRLRLVPDVGESFARSAAELLFTLAGILWLDPESAPLALLAAALTVGVPFLLLPRLMDWDLRVRNHAGALSRFYLDALLGLFPIRTHGAQNAVRRQHEGLLTAWARAHLRLRGAEVVADTAVQAVMVAMTIALLFDHLARRGLDGGVLLLVYWALKILSLGQMLILMIATQYPSHRNVALRLLEPLGAPEEGPLQPAQVEEAGHDVAGAGVRLAWEGVTVRAAGHTILEAVDLALEPGSQVAIVGPSGAGKSSLVGTLLGWHRPAAGRVLVDGEPLAGERLQELRRETAWVDPAVQIWNRTLLENLRYGTDGALARPIDAAVRQAELLGVLRKLPEGLQTPLGEGGGLVSGGEGQRVRFARSLLRPGVRLVLLDEPFRGLGREQRRELLDRARALWRGATLLCITHDVGETLGFERVLVVEGGRVVEDGPPAVLAERPASRYGALLAAEREVRQGLWESPVWRRLRLEAGRLSPTEGR